MAVYNNRYYPDTAISTWQDLADAGATWADCDQDWITASALVPGAGANWSYTTDATDLGTSKWFYPTTTVSWDDTEPVAITYLVSNDDSTYTELSPGVLNGRYIKTKITTAGAWLASINTDINTTPITETHYDLSTSTLSGTVDARVLSTARFSQIQSVVITAGVSETRAIQGQIISNNSGSITFRVIDVDTWAKVAVDANVNIVIVGFPNIVEDQDAGTVSIT
jgi:hypothetical protein